MASKNKTVYVCTECGAESPKWSGKCPACGQWDTMTEFKITAPEKATKTTSSKMITSTAVKLSEIDETDEVRTQTGIGELDRVLGGGIVKGSLILVTGEPGIGKSTILLQLCLHLGLTNKILYVSGEESPRQIKLRADRLGLADGQVYLLSKTDIEEVCEYARIEKPDILIIDSIQTMQKEDVNSSPGSVSQVKEATAMLMNFAKSEEIPVFVVGHVNKEGAVAGPKVMEHMVDAVLYFEGDRSQEYRILRAVKNRFGSTNEIGVFEMTGSGLKEVENPSQLFLQGKPTDMSGIATACVMEGTRPIVAEIQSLVTPTPFPAPRRVSVGFDYNRLNLIIAVLEKRCKLFFGQSDTYLNIIGGIRLDDPAADLAVAIALASGLKDFIIPEDTMIIGELGLAGEIRAVTSLERRVTEARNLGFKRCLVPSRNKIDFHSPIEIIQADNVRDALNKL
ncbi:MAG: DNA repair protein RadA [Ruminococcaceae bacterium]|nr:DNA repair protein RadA [Oscillospiraceae bacterium]